MKITDPFNRPTACQGCNKSGCSCGGLGSGNYLGKKEIESVLSNSRPYILVRTDRNFPCACVDLNSGSGKDTCTRCFGTGKTIISLDVFRAQPTSVSPDSSKNLQVSGLDRAENVTFLAGRWLYPVEGQLVLEVGWNGQNSTIYSSKSKPVDLYNIYYITNVSFVGPTEISYIKFSSKMSNDRLPYIRQMVIKNDISLHPMKYLDSTSKVNLKALYSGHCDC